MGVSTKELIIELAQEGDYAVKDQKGKEVSDDIYMDLDLDETHRNLFRELYRLKIKEQGKNPCIFKGMVVNGRFPKE